MHLLRCVPMFSLEIAGICMFTIINPFYAAPVAQKADESVAAWRRFYSAKHAAESGAIVPSVITSAGSFRGSNSGASSPSSGRSSNTRNAGRKTPRPRVAATTTAKPSLIVEQIVPVNQPNDKDVINESFGSVSPRNSRGSVNRVKIGGPGPGKAASSETLSEIFGEFTTENPKVRPRTREPEFLTSEEIFELYGDDIDSDDASSS